MSAVSDRRKIDIMKKRTIGIIVGIAAVAAVFLIYQLCFKEKKTDAAGTSAGYTISVAELTGSGAVGAVNRFSGVVEAEETWSVNQNPDSKVKEILVSVGDMVKAGDVLFTYDTEKYKTDQAQAEIDLERLNNELETIGQTIAQLQADQKKAKASEQADYTIRIQDAELQQKQKELDIRSKEIEIRKLIDNQEHASVTSQIDGVVHSINDSESSTSNSDSGFITVMKTDDLRIKGTVNEQNIGQITVGSPVIVHSRVDENQTWSGMISDINTESTVNNQSSYLFGNSDTGGSNYYFYVTLENSEGLMLGQHVYLEDDLGQTETTELDGIWIPSYFVADADTEHPYVQVQNAAGAVEKREVKTGEYDEELMIIQVVEGLEPEDLLALPDNVEIAEGESA